MSDREKLILEKLRNGEIDYGTESAKTIKIDSVAPARATKRGQIVTNQEFSIWANYIKAIVYRKIQKCIFVTGQYPQAIIAGGEYQYAFVDVAREIQRTTDGGILWRGIPLIRSGPHAKVSVVWNMEDLNLPQPPKGE